LREQSLTESPRKRAKLLAELGRIEADELGDAGAALGHFEQAIALDADNEEAALKVVDAYVAAERWSEAAPVLEGLVRRGSKRDPEEQRRLHSLLSVVQTSLGDDESAWKALEAAYQLDPTHRPTLRGLADLYFRAKDWEGARDFYQAILDHHGRALGAAEATEIQHRLGVALGELGDADGALASFERALEKDKRHRPTLEAMAALYASRERWDQVVFVKRKVLEGADAAERHALLVQIGDLWRKVEQFAKAVQSYGEALEADPDDHLTQHKLLEIYTVTKQWPKVVETVLEIAKGESNPAKLAKYYYSIAAICRDELAAPDYAIQYYNEVLDRDPKHAKAYEAIERILVQTGDWQGAERNIRMQLHRIVGQGETDLEVRLWQNLGDIYQHRLGQLDAAAEALQMAARIDPDDVGRHEALAAIYLALPGRHHDAVAQHQKLLVKSPMRTESYQALARIYFHTRQYDPAWCVCAALSFLGRADSEQRQFYETYRTNGPVAAQGRLDQARWIEDLFHPSEDPIIGKTFEALTAAVRSLKVQPAKAYGLRPKDRREPATDTLLLSKLFGYIAPVLNLPTPHLYVQPDQPGGLVYAITEPPATVAGSQLLTGKSPQELAFVVGRHLAYYRGEHYVRWIMTTAAELGTLLLAGIKIGAPGVKLPADPGVDQTALALAQAMTPVAREALQLLCRRLVETGLQLDVKRWMTAIDLTACQAGLLFCNDLEIAARTIRDDAWSVGDMPAQDKIKELILFSVSDRYFRLRRALGVDIRE
jgi:tetratricopeptide (TPR) repeat protein